VGYQKYYQVGNQKYYQGGNQKYYQGGNQKYYQAGLMYMLPESSGILPECHIYNQTKSLFRHILPVIGFQHSIALWKVHNKRKQIAQFLQRSFAQISAQTP